jgi:UPF0755 protein
MKRFSLFVVILVVFSFGIYHYYHGALNYQKDPSGRTFATVTIPDGASADTVAAILKDEGLIRSEWVFAYYVDQNDYASQLKAGKHLISADGDLSEIVDALVSGELTQSGVTLLEGWTSWEMAEHLESLGLTTRDSFMDCLVDCIFEADFLTVDGLEGYLYPDTYFVDPNAYSDQSFIQRLLTTFESKLSNEDWEAIETSDRTLEEVIIMASIVEREERNPDEMPTVAGVLWSRYDSDHWIGADATVLYALGRTSGGLTGTDLDNDSPYNTRKFRGLPPGPISNPGLASIRAAIYPEETDYFYYLHDAEGNIHYGRTLEEHNLNKAKYL